jgi:hypothetical protein
MPTSFPPSTQKVLANTVPSGATYMPGAFICTHLLPVWPKVLPIQDVLALMYYCGCGCTLP